MAETLSTGRIGETDLAITRKLELNRRKLDSIWSALRQLMFFKAGDLFTSF
jgi:hypothetical protein